MSTSNPFPLQITFKVNSPELLATLLQFGPERYADANDFKEIIDALNYLYENIGFGSGGATIEEVIEAIAPLASDINNVGNNLQTHIENANNPHETDLNQILAQGFEAINKALKLKYNFGAQDVLELKPDAFSMFDAAGIVMLQMYKNAFLAKNHASGSTKLGFQSTTSVVEVMFRNLAGTVALLSDINNYYKGTYSTLSALNTAHPSSTAGSYAIVDGGIGVEPIQYLWDANDNEWIAGSSSSPTTTDDLTEGTGNLYFTNARAVAALASALALKANIPKSLRATSNIVLTATTASQKLFRNLGDNGDGSFNVEVGRYRIEILITLTNLATINSSIGFLTGIGDGTSAFSNILIAVTAWKAGLTSSGTGIFTRMTSFSSNPAITSATTNANGFAQGLGEFSVTTAGKFYPAISLNVASTVELITDSYCTIIKIR